MILLSCGQNHEDSISTDRSKSNDRLGQETAAIKKDVTIDKEIVLENPTLLVIEIDSVEIEELRLKSGGDNFYTATDDLMWYHSQLLKKMDTLDIPVLYEEGTVRIVTPTTDYEVLKDSTFSLYTYFFFNGDTVLRKDVFDLLTTGKN